MRFGGENDITAVITASYLGNEYPTKHYFGIPRHTQSMIDYKILTEYCWKFQWKIALWESC
mgnify:CR=1 FL=1